MAADVETRILRLVQNYRIGAYCESIFYGCLIEIADDCAPDRLWTALPDDVRDGLRNAMLHEEEWARSEGLTETRGFQKLHEWLSAR